ncbi:HD domain-containing protein [Candidatus Dojkabacteria bacterium]|nr:HD domain-containing protein [Candidatus Dojkabacteria bacterium]
MTRDEALKILDTWSTKPFSKKHMLAVEECMRSYARKFGKDEEKWGIAGLLHDADWDSFPDEHPKKIVALLREKGEEEIAQAVAGHGDMSEQYLDKDGNPRFTERKTLMDKALYACDEITGFIMAVSYVRPNGIADIEPKSVKKKLKDKAFAAQVNREEIYKGAEELGIDFDKHLQFVIEAMKLIQSQLAK